MCGPNAAVGENARIGLKHHLHLLGRIVFIDETGLNTKMARLRGRSAKGQRLIASIPHGHWKTMTFIAGLRP